MNPDYQLADLSQEDLTRLEDMERELSEMYNNKIVLVAYEQSQRHEPQVRAKDRRLEVDTLGNDINKRGSTFGYADAHGDHYPTLASLTVERLIEGEDLRFEDTEPPNRE